MSYPEQYPTDRDRELHDADEFIGTLHNIKEGNQRLSHREAVCSALKAIFPRSKIISSVDEIWDSHCQVPHHDGMEIWRKARELERDLAAAQARIKEMTEIGIEIQNERLAKYENAVMPEEKK